MHCHRPRLLACLLLLGASACSPPVSGDPDASAGDHDASRTGDPDAYTPGAGCPSFDVEDPTQVAYGRNSPGDATIGADTTWTADHTYFVIGSLDVQGATLTIEAGTQVCLDAGGGSAPLLDFREAAGGGGRSALVVHGTSEAPVVFAPATPDSTWNGIVLSSVASASLSHLTLIGGGAGGAGVLHVDDNFEGLLEAEEVHLVGGAGTLLSPRNDGLAPGASVYLDAQATDRVDVAMEVSLRGLATLEPATIHFGAALPAAARVVRVTSGAVEEDTTIPGDLGVSFLFRDDVIVQRADASSPIPTLTIEAGATVLFDGTSLHVGSAAGLDEDGGNLVAVGTAERPIRLASASPTPAAGDWEGVILVASAVELDVTALAHVTIEDAGRDLGGEGAVLHCATLPTPVLGALRLRGNGFEDYEGPSITSLTVTRSAGDGLAFACLDASCLLTDYAAEVSGTEIAGELLRDRTCP